MEFIVINGVHVAIPAEVVSEGREAVAAWVTAEARRLAQPPSQPEG